MSRMLLNRKHFQREQSYIIFNIKRKIHENKIHYFQLLQETDQSLLTSFDRKKTLKMLIINTSEPKPSDMSSTVRDPIEILIGLYLSENDTEQHEKFMQNLLRCRYQNNLQLRYCSQEKIILLQHRINANYTPKTFQRDDLEYYIPQLCSFIAFHQEFKVENMIKFIKQAGQINFYFAHLFYFYLRSLSYIVSKKETTALKMQVYIYQYPFNIKQILNNNLSSAFTNKMDE